MIDTSKKIMPNFKKTLSLCCGGKWNVSWTSKFIILLIMEAITMGRITPIIVAVAFVLIAILFIYYSMKSLIDSSTGSNLMTQTCGVKIPDFLINQHVDRNRSVRSHYKKVLAKNLARRTQKQRIKALKLSKYSSEEKKTLRFCSVGL